nr:enoyl-CoA hydratase/isomerase family protein [Hoyosella altamirensis]
MTRTANRTGVISLNRPAALNALDTSMIQAINVALDSWMHDTSVSRVVIRSTSPKAFCAGGDIRAIRDAVLTGQHDAAHEFFRLEYDLNERIATFPKPIIALIDGAAMGGGLGVSVHGSLRVVTENAVCAMPETAIGFFPDIGASYFLPRLGLNGTGSVALGKYLGMTGARLDAADAVTCGLATHFVRSERLADLLAALEDEGEADAAAIIESFASDPGPSALASHMETIEECFSAGTVTEMEDCLANGRSEWHAQVLATLRKASPRSVCITMRLIERGAVSTLRECLDRELALTAPVTRHPDFAEGIRAVLVDKDRNPQWADAALADVDPVHIDALLL